MATSAIPSGGSFTPAAPLTRPVQPTASGGNTSPLAAAAYAQALGTLEPVIVPGLPSRADAVRRPPSLQARPEYALVMLMAQRPGQLRRLFESLGGTGASLDVEAAGAELQEHIGAGGTLAQFGAKRQLDPTTLYLLSVQSRLAQRSGKFKVSRRFEHDMDDLLAEHETEIGAALNTSQAMRALAGSASDRMWMRSLYVAAITVRSPINETFESLLQRFGTDGFEQGASTLLRALSDDIAAQRSSVSPDRLQGLLLASLVSMRHVLGLIHSSQGFLRSQGVVSKTAAAKREEDASKKDEQERKEHGKEQQKQPGKELVDGATQSVLNEQQRRAEALTVQLVKLLLQLTVNSSAARAVPGFLYQDVGSGFHGPELVRLRAQFMELLRELPTSLWKEAAHKDQLLESLRRQFENEMIQRALPSPQGGSPRA